MKHNAILSAAVVMALMGASPTAAQSVQPIQFARGASSATVNGSIQGQEFIDYHISVRSGQDLSVTMRTLSGSPYFNVMEPGSADVAIYNSSMGDPRFSGITAKSGAYTVRVYQMRASGRRGEDARFQLIVSASDDGVTDNGPSQPPGDALVPGTPYHATSMLPCISTPGMTMGSCKAGVIRRGAGSATVHLDTPDGGQRTILFRDGVAVSSDGDSRISVERREDTSIVRIGAAEVYEIPDAFVFGG